MLELEVEAEVEIEVEAEERRRTLVVGCGRSVAGDGKFTGCRLKNCELVDEGGPWRG